MAFEASKRIRDKRLRRRLLMVLQSASAVGVPNAEVSGETLAIEAARFMPRDQRWENDEHKRRLIAELAAKGLIDARDARVHKRLEESSLATTMYRLTAKGSDLLNEFIAPDPAIEDDRVEDEE